MPEVSASVDAELYAEVKRWAEYRGLRGTADYVRAALVQLTRRDRANASKGSKGMGSTENVVSRARCTVCTIQARESIKQRGET